MHKIEEILKKMFAYEQKIIFNKFKKYVLVIFAPSLTFTNYN